MAIACFFRESCHLLLGASGSCSRRPAGGRGGTQKQRRLYCASHVHPATTFVCQNFRDCRRTSPIWQRGFFDHVLRNDESYGDKWNYVRENPVSAGFVNDPYEWRYSGEIVVIDRA